MLDDEDGCFSVLLVTGDGGLDYFLQWQGLLGGCHRLAWLFWAFCNAKRPVRPGQTGRFGVADVVCCNLLCVSGWRAPCQSRQRLALFLTSVALALVVQPWASWPVTQLHVVYVLFHFAIVAFQYAAFLVDHVE